MIKELKIDLDKLLENKLKLEEYFLLWSLVFNKQVIAEEYAVKCNKFSNALLVGLKDKGFIDFEVKEKILFKDIKTTPKSLDLFKVSSSLTFDKAFEELRSLYPAKVPDGSGSYRRLHQDLERCKKLYKELILAGVNIDAEKHEIVKNCVSLYHKEHNRGGRTAYMQLLATWLHQKTYEQYWEEAKKGTQIVIDNKTSETSI